jgi:hypothetical protein
VGWGFKINGFRPKIDSKKPSIHLKPVYKSSGQGFKLFFRSSLRPKDAGRGPSVLAETRGASNETSSPEILTKEVFGFDSVLGLLEVGSEMFLKVHRLGNVVLDSTAQDGLDPMNSGPTLKPEGSSPAPVHLFSCGSSSGAAKLGERLHRSRPMALILKPFQNYYRKAREGRAVQMDEGLFLESMVAMRLGFTGGIPFPLSSHS